MSAVPEPGLPNRVGPGADGSPRRLVIRSFPYRHWLLAAFLLFLAGFMFFRIVRGTVEDIIVGIASTGWWQYAAAGLLCSIALAIAAQGEVEMCRFDKVEDSFVLTTWSIRSGRQRVRRFAMSDIASVKPCILQRNTEHKHYKVIVAFADSTRVFLLDTRSRQVVVDNVRRIRLHVFNDSTTASRRVARRRRRRQEHAVTRVTAAGGVANGDGECGSPSCLETRAADRATSAHAHGHGRKRRDKERSGKVHADPTMRKERRRERKARKPHPTGSPLSGKDISLDTAEAGAGAGSWKGATLAHSPPLPSGKGDVEMGHTPAAAASASTATATAGAAVPPSPTQGP